ncbi:Putative WW domain, FF domain, WW domain superfamily, FF domain superfamily protein [Septoria linicola]|uniref:WW domain, FF domain, WW domain superfamily, FF domain superfamily protein n=1 Tax=Septoria linicola TaxID=215465 RepID=A0A9Q9AID4_9PEZI|nr:putative WW domain, FF domain, WW domain superfamily, FF domain superfamily protein [Septoria linicola]USW47483.1 Putative WW domain, FF domain, WW domain superfamily, FF domain superfamily protein [Septoria linicola]
MSEWAAAQTAEGRVYYYNKTTKLTTWEKPADVDIAPPAAPAAPKGPAGSAADWAEAKTPEGRLYYYNKATKETSWTLPEAVRKQQEAQAQQQNGRPDFVAGGGGGGGGYGGREDYHGGRGRRDDRDHGLPQKPSFDRGGDRGDRGGNPWEARREQTGYGGPMPAKTDEPEYGSAEAAEEAFFKLLKRNNITPDAEWQDALRVVVRDREYRAIKDPKERKAAFEKYCADMRAEQKSKDKERREKAREDFQRMLSTHDEIEHYTRWKSARPTIEHEAAFKSAGDEDERVRIFDEYVLELKKQHVENEAKKRKDAMQELQKTLEVLILDPNTTWTEAEDKIDNNERFVSDETLKGVHKLDIFLAFENHMKALERSANEATQKEKQLKKRKQRQARDAYKHLLNEKLREGKIKAGSKWSKFFPLIKDEEHFLNYLAVPVPPYPGATASSAQELFWDIVEDEERKLRSKRNDALDVLEEQRFEVTLETSPSEFTQIMHSHPRTANLNDVELSMIFDRILQKVKRREEEKQIGAERQQKAIVDSIRSAMKKVHPPIRSDESYEDVVARLSGIRDWDTAEEEVRKRAYDKYMVRLREKDDDRRRDRERDRSREYRNVSRRDERDDRRERDRRHRTRTPEIDAYEADRRKAQADRERQYRKASFGLTPPRAVDRYEDRERRDDRRDDRRRPTRDDLYDNERRAREAERERNFMSRADPRDKGRTLDYGDDDVVGSRPPSVRKRRESDASMASRRDTKRPRREGGRTHSPEPDSSLLKEEPPALQSGSEEGEIEEV